MGLTFFSFLMGSITSIFSTSDNFDDLIEQKLDSLDMWIKKIEKSNKPYHIQPTLYNDIRNDPTFFRSKGSLNISTSHFFSISLDQKQLL